MNILTFILIKFIKIYQFLLSPLLGQSCRHYPTCSNYSIEALKTYGLLKGLFLIIKRIFSCHPWAEGGYDPIKKQTKIRK
tara:strand:+ start:342 stop:581 length:240 start_codon:yes stop_codon:yes gene_type:complete